MVDKSLPKKTLTINQKRFYINLHIMDLPLKIFLSHSFKKSSPKFNNVICAVTFETDVIQIPHKKEITMKVFVVYQVF
jgi:hypothetical protein